MALGMCFMLLTFWAMFGTSVPQSTPCPDGWTQFQNTCYNYVLEKVTWDEANYRCAYQGANLAEPDTDEKSHFLSQTLKARGWLGATDSRTEGTWIWFGSERPVLSLPWYPGQPNSRYGDEDCLALHDGWFDLPCTWGRNYICEKQATL